MIRLALALMFLPCAAAAAVCNTRAVMVETLASKYGEQKAGAWIQKAPGVKMVMEIWISIETGTVTILRTGPNGISCIVAAGTDFFGEEVASVAEGDPT